MAKLDLEVPPQSMGFGAVTLTTSAEQAVTIANTSTTDVTLPAPVLGGPHAQAFARAAACTTALPSGTCTRKVRFVPDRVLHRVAPLQIAPGHEVMLPSPAAAEPTGAAAEAAPGGETPSLA